MPADEQRDRMRSMRTLVAEFNVYRWAGRMLVDAARLRRRERLSGRLSQPAAGAARGRGVMRDILAQANREVLEQFACSRTLLAFDFDGTLAPIVADPDRAAMRAPTRRLLRPWRAPTPAWSSRAGPGRRRRAAPRGRLAGVVGNHGLEPSGTLRLG